MNLIRIAAGQVLAVTMVHLGERMGLVSLRKQQRINGYLPNVASPQLHQETMQEQKVYLPKDPQVSTF